MDKEFNIKYLAGFFTIVIFLLINNPLIRLFMACIFILISFLSGSKVKLKPNLILFISITIITILSPEGLVLFSIGSLKITKGALLTGIDRSSLLIGLLYLSKNISMSNIKFSGKIGIIIRDTFHYFNQLTSGEQVKFKNLIPQLDNKLLSLTPYNLKDYSVENTKKRNSNYIILFLTLILFLLDKLLYNF